MKIKMSMEEGRKYTYVVVVFITATVLVCTKVISGMEWVTVVSFLGASFGIANAMEKKWSN